MNSYTRNREPTQRCAIYTRKSSEEGLEQEFNSLNAQWEACAAYIASQKHQGWVLVDERFEDGGFSGGNIERPGLNKLMDAVRRDEIDIIVFYKLDRFSRSTIDFAALLGVLEKHDVSFVSVTQPFQTADSMGRLNMNMLMTFAQFEREVTSERIRDKFAQSKMKGMWMGGRVPYGYDVEDRKLVVNPGETQVVNIIFETFVETRSLTETCYRVNDMGFRTKLYRHKDGSTMGGMSYTKSTLRKMLTNKIYLGLIHHKGQWYPGQHKAIINRNLWETVEKIFASNRFSRRTDSCRRNSPAFLRGLLFGPDGIALVPTSARRRGKRYRYYTSNTALKQGYREKIIPPLPAEPLEQLVIQEVGQLLKSPSLLLKVFKTGQELAPSLKYDQVVNAFGTLDQIWVELFPNEQQRLAQLLIKRINVSGEGVHIHFHGDHLPEIMHEMSGEPV
ncbi:recombinase family protein [Sansalvadorimonas verongulae]|uniref:recombinase family protein n=1 Tax=Sansalvadorimonas verongulae TaxID=2172824 RepID=UPI0018AD2DD8|nr:recombinase family protein [Sansalvadorimonas verongulae]